MKEKIKKYIKAIGVLLTEPVNTLIQNKFSSIEKASQLSLQLSYRAIAEQYINNKQSWLPSFE